MSIFENLICWGIFALSSSMKIDVNIRIVLNLLKNRNVANLYCELIVINKINN